MKSSRKMYDKVRDVAIRRVPRRYEGRLGYAIDMKEVYKIFFDNDFSKKTKTADIYIGEWIDFGLAEKDSTGRVLWIVDETLRPRLELEQRYHPDCAGLEVVA